MISKGRPQFNKLFGWKNKFNKTDDHYKFICIIQPNLYIFKQTSGTNLKNWNHSNFDYKDPKFENWASHWEYIHIRLKIDI
jgi:hypothetical protein